MCKSLFSATLIIKNPNVVEFKTIKNPMKAPIVDGPNHVTFRQSKVACWKIQYL